MTTEGDADDASCIPFKSIQPGWDRRVRAPVPALDPSGDNAQLSDTPLPAAPSWHPSAPDRHDGGHDH